MNKLLTVSPSPHIHDKDSVRKIMLRVVLALIPALAWSVVVFGFDALKITFIAVASCLVFEYLIQRFVLKTKPSINDGSALVTGVLLAFNVPSNLPWWIVITGAFVAIAIAKLSFGGLGNNIFNPALVGRVFLLISFPAQMTSWPTNHMSGIDAITSATPLGLLKESIKSGRPLSEISGHLPKTMDLLLGNIGGSLGEVSALLLILGGIYLLLRKVITWHTPVSVLFSMFVFSGILWLINPSANMNPVFHILSGGAMLGAIFMATDMVTSPMTAKGQLIYGTGIGLLTILIRDYGAYPEGISFAILLMNALTPLINRYVKPKRFGEKVAQPKKS
jgi:Na+-translocating ferredoxin:NAD+ oxidoreductase subunit D